MNYTWNPITGCRGGCDYCYARRLYERFGMSFEPTFHPERLTQPSGRKEPARIFCGSTTDLWGLRVPPAWRIAVWMIMKESPRHTFMVLTKRPDRIDDWDVIPDNVWIGVTVEDWSRNYRVMHLAPDNGRHVHFVSCEPMTDPPALHWPLVDWVIIGAMTGPGSKGQEPRPGCVERVISEARENSVPVFTKRNLKRNPQIKEWPIGAGRK